ncbi:sensor histidine kinase [Cohnella abietis]|uniref:histidine kinase n=1 Tax=Cohnella abietis TaxID=2507935 RepID=A0A3T1D913_9BACL|nr:sensor histidine kinase [Cohnella abietis]BBI34587.1 hypothetical protein KCTCHS21_39860 [Cohnella abietis]
MRQLLVWLQHLLIVLPAIATVYVISIPSIATYVAYLLFALLLVRITELAPRFSYLLVPIEIIGFGWLSYTYGGLLFFLLYSSLVSIFLYFRRPIEIVSLVLLTNVALNVASHQEDSLHIWIVNLTWLALTLLLVAIQAMTRKQLQLERSYETLSLKQDIVEQELTRTLEYARKIEDYAQVQERGRIATELHDDLGHRLIRVKMMTEAALQLLERDPKKANHMIEQVRDQLEESMNNMRYTVRKLQPKEASNARRYALHRLIEDAGRDLQIDVSFDITGKPFPLYPSVEYVLYRNAQEAITNAVRHGGASTVEIVVDFTSDQITMSITNNGKLPDAVAFGMGLRGMQERLTLLGGQLVVSLEHGFVITTIVPYHETTPPIEGE